MRLDPSSKALRLSLMFWNAPPDVELLTAAEKGELNTPKGLSRQVDRLLASPRLETGTRAFFTDMLAFEYFDDLAKDPSIYPNFTLKVAADSKEQMLRTIVDHLLVRKADYRDLFTTRHTFITGDLAMVYRVPVERPLSWSPYEFSADSPRGGGLLTELGYLGLYSHPGRSSPTKRGKALRELFLCQKVPDPPPNVDFSKVEDPKKIFKTARERLTVHRSDPACAGCHKITDPMGLALENFDGAGQWRDDENGAAIDSSGVLDGITFTNAQGLAQAVHDHPATTSCLASRLYSYGVGGEIRTEDRDLIKYFDGRFKARGYRYPDLLREIAQSESFFAVSKDSS
jgi:hypothetical protein